MARLIRFTTFDGPKVYINPDHIVMIASYEGDPARSAVVRLSAPGLMEDGKAFYSVHLADTAAGVFRAIEDHYAGLPPRG